MTIRAELGGQLLFSSAVPGRGVSAGTLDLSLGAPGSASFTLPFGHPGQELVGGGKDILRIYRDDEVLFCGRTEETELDLYGNLTVTAGGILNALADARFTVPAGRWTRSQTALENLLNACSSVCGGSLCLTAGHVDEVSGAACWLSGGVMSGLDLLDDLTDTLGGYAVIRCEGDAIYLDWLAADSLPLCAQTVRAGENLIDLSCVTAVPAATVLLPAGKDPDGNELSIASVNPTGLSVLRNEEAIARHGVRRLTKDFGTLLGAQMLYDTAVNWFAENSGDIVSITARAADLSQAGEDTAPFRMGQRVRLCVPARGIDLIAPVSRQSLSLCDPTKNRVTIGAKRRRITDT